MKQKYFLRGMGIGIIVSTLIFLGVNAFKGPDIMSDEDIKAEAMRLGMVMKEEAEATKKDTNNNAENENNEADATESDIETTGDKTTVENLTGDDVIPTEDTTENRIGEEKEDTATKKEKEETKNQTVDSGNMVNVILKDGQDSLGAARSIKAAGLVDDAAAFNQYLEDNGYDRKIRPGTHKIRTGSNFKTIAEEITK